jgi:NAD(P)-dependent dehydrogenase (short-subunit alcohol dehydrogenase family)
VVSGRLAERVFVVTGADGGIGRGIVRALLDDGATAVLTDLDEQATSDATGSSTTRGRS